MAWLRSGSGSAVHTDAVRKADMRLDEDTATLHREHANMLLPFWLMPWANTNLHDHAGSNAFRPSSFALKLSRRAASRFSRDLAAFLLSRALNSTSLAAVDFRKMSRPGWPCDRMCARAAQPGS